MLGRNLVSSLGYLKNAAIKEGLKAPEYPNHSLNVGLFDERTESIHQVNFFNLIKKLTPKPIINKDYDQGNTPTDHGAATVPEFKDFYTGNSYGV